MFTGVVFWWFREWGLAGLQGACLLGCSLYSFVPKKSWVRGKSSENEGAQKK